jgi:hypothetical protein
MNLTFSVFLSTFCSSASWFSALLLSAHSEYGKQCTSNLNAAEQHTRESFPWTKCGGNQGDRIGRNFNFWAVGFWWQFLKI